MTPHPDVVPLGGFRVQEMDVRPSPDWIVCAGGRTWVTGVDGGVAVYGSSSGWWLGSIPIDGELCAAPDVGFDSVWFPTCGRPAIHRVSVTTQDLVASIPIELLPDGEFTIGVGEGGVWAVLRNGNGLARIDPQDHRVVRAFEIPPGAVSVRAGLGGLWVAYPEQDRVLRVDPATGEVVAAYVTERGPRFLTVGAGGVWVLNQASGSVTHVDPETEEVSTIPVDHGPMKGGDIAIGDGSVWVRGTAELVAEIDPSSRTVVARYGAPSIGSASVGAAEGQLWASAGAEGKLYRIDVGERSARERTVGPRGL